MSDFLFSTRRRAPGELQAVLARQLAPVDPALREWHGDWGSLAVARFAHDAESDVVEADGRISVLVGDPVVRGGLEEPGRARLGGRRRTVHALLADAFAVRWAERVDSGFAALTIDTARGGGAVVTDIGAFVPVFAARAYGEAVIGTHLDAVARAAGRVEVDAVSATDLALFLTCTYPHTLFRGVTQLAPASVHAFAADGSAAGERAYWAPSESNPYRTIDDAATALREAVEEQVRAVCAETDEAAVLLSGGEDARAILGAIPSGPRVSTFVYGDWFNREVRVAQAVARAYGAAFTFGERAPDHYVGGMREVASLIGGHNLFMDVHGFGLHRRLRLDRFPVVLGGLSSDSFLKAEHLPAAGSADAVEMPPVDGLKPELVEAAVARRLAFRRWLAETRPRTAGEWERLWPFTQRKHSANYHGNRRLFASHEPYHSNAVVTLAAAVPPEWKLRRRLFHRAMRPLFRRSWWVPHSRWRYPYFGPVANLPLTAGLRIARGVRAVVTGEVRARQQPWPKWRVVAGSEAAERERLSRPILDTPAGVIFAAGTEEEAARAVRATWHPLRRLILLQLAAVTARAVE